LRVDTEGNVGLPAAKTKAKSGTHYTGSYVRVPADRMGEFRRAVGFDGPTPFRVTLNQGRLEGTGLYLDLAAADGGAAGTVRGGAMPVLEHFPIRMTGCNSRWPVGLWKNGSIEPFSVFEDVAFGRLDVTGDGQFYFGNLLTASDQALCLALASEWTDEGTVIAVHNPTEAEIEATIQSPPSIDDRMRIDLRVTIPPGASLMKEISRASQ
jgi:hypothetical protein